MTIDFELEEEIEEEAQSILPRSYLVADIGRSNTRVAFFDLVEGSYRFIARGTAMTTAGPPWYDVMLGLSQAVGQVSSATGRVLLDGQGQLIQPAHVGGVGFDLLAVATSVAEPIRVLIAGLLDEVSIASARRALRTVYATEVDCFSLSDTRDRTAQIDALVAQQPDLIFLTGGTDGGADRRLLDLVTTLVIGLKLLDEGQRPAILYAGNAALRPKINEEISGLTELHFVENVRPEFESETIDHAVAMLADLYLNGQAGLIPGVSSLRERCSVPLKTTAHAAVGITEYLASVSGGQVMCLDVGNHQLTVGLAGKEGVDLAVFGELGMGKALGELATEAKFEEFADWLYPDTTFEDVRNFTINRSLRPNMLALTETAVRIEQSLLRLMVSQAAANLSQQWGWSTGVPPLRFLVLRGGILAGTERPHAVLLALLDALQPTGLFRVAADPDAILPALGLLAPEDPKMVVQVLGNSPLTDWGWVIVPEGRARLGEIVLKVNFNSVSLDTLEVDIPYGEIEVLPLPPGESAQVTLTPAPGIDVGFGRGVTKTVRLTGGDIGLVVDARGRPLNRPKDLETRRNLVQKWLRDFGG